MEIFRNFKTMSSHTHFKCNESPCVDELVLVFDWPTHMANKHQNNSAQADLNKTAVTPNVVNPAATSVSLVGRTTLMDRLQINTKSIMTAKPKNIGLTGIFREAELDKFFQIVKGYACQGNDYDRAEFVVTLISHGFECDWGDESFLVGTFWVTDVTGAEQPIVSWAGLWAEVRAVFETQYKTPATPRHIGRALGKVAYQMLMTPGSSLATAYADSVPNWASRYSSSEAWWAASSVMPFMKERSSWSPAEIAVATAHRDQVTKVSNNFNADTVAFEGVDPNMQVAGSSTRKLLLRQLAISATNADVSKVAEIGKMIAGPGI